MAPALEEQLRVFSQPRAVQRGLPATAYTGDEFWRAEQDSVFADNWVFAGFCHEMPSPGDAVPVSIGGRPVLLLRNRAGDIRAFHNVCRHRCLKLVDAPGNVGRMITCPYHAWAYGLDGALRSTPHFGGVDRHESDGFDAADHGLKSVRCFVWHDWIFVNLSGTAPEFEDYAAPLMAWLDRLDFDALSPVAMLDFGEVATNWKFIMENFIEPYHVQYVHSTTTAQPLRDHYTIVDGSCIGSAVDLGTEGGAQNSLAVSSRYLTLFPTFVLGRYFPDQLGVYLNIPLSPGRMSQKRAIYTTDRKPRTDAEVAAIKDLWWRVHKEDHAMCERLQLGRASPVAQDGGALSPHWENSVRAFQEKVAEGVLSLKQNEVHQNA